jgi:MoxR-like ATPase
VTGYEVGAAAPLVPTPVTRRRLETLAAACLSGRTVCLEGDTGSGKSALVAELARLAGRRLRVVAMTVETG